MLAEVKSYLDLVCERLVVSRLEKSKLCFVLVFPVKHVKIIY